jgi:hypothetical protein
VRATAHGGHRADPRPRGTRLPVVAQRHTGVRGLTHLPTPQPLTAGRRRDGCERTPVVRDRRVPPAHGRRAPSRSARARPARGANGRGTQRCTPHVCGRPSTRARPGEVARRLHRRQGAERDGGLPPGGRPRDEAAERDAREGGRPTAPTTRPTSESGLDRTDAEGHRVWDTAWCGPWRWAWGRPWCWDGASRTRGPAWDGQRRCSGSALRRHPSSPSSQGDDSSRREPYARGEERSRRHCHAASDHEEGQRPVKGTRMTRSWPRDPAPGGQRRRAPLRALPGRCLRLVAWHRTGTHDWQAWRAGRLRGCGSCQCLGRLLVLLRDNPTILSWTITGVHAAPVVGTARGDSTVHTLLAAPRPAARGSFSPKKAP